LQREFYPREALLEAELAAWTGNVDYAMEQYAEAETMSCQERYLDLQGLACERAGLTWRQFGGDKSTVNAHLKRAVVAYTKWGALAVVERVQALLLPLTEEMPQQAT